MHLVGFIIRIRHDARSSERQINKCTQNFGRKNILGRPRLRRNFNSNSKDWNFLKSVVLFDGVASFAVRHENFLISAYVNVARDIHGLFNTKLIGSDA